MLRLVEAAELGMEDSVVPQTRNYFPGVMRDEGGGRWFGRKKFLVGGGEQRLWGIPLGILGTLWGPSKSHTNALILLGEKLTPSSCKHLNFIY